MGCQPGTGNTKGGFGDTSEKTLDLDPTQFERHVDVVLERWKGNTESILLFVRVSILRADSLRGLSFFSTLNRLVYFPQPSRCSSSKATTRRHLTWL
jgi:hypothetical protein